MKENELWKYLAQLIYPWQILPSLVAISSEITLCQGPVHAARFFILMAVLIASTSFSQAIVTDFAVLTRRVLSIRCHVHTISHVHELTIALDSFPISSMYTANIRAVIELSLVWLYPRKLAYQIWFQHPSCNIKKIKRGPEIALNPLRP